MSNEHHKYESKGTRKSGQSSNLEVSRRTPILRIIYFMLVYILLDSLMDERSGIVCGRVLQMNKAIIKLRKRPASVSFKRRIFLA